MSDVVQTRRRGRVLEITLDRPKANAIDAATSRMMSRAIVEFRDDPQLWVAIITGTGRFFSAGWDLKAAAVDSPAVLAEDYGEGGFGGLTEMFHLQKPVIAAINGYAAGGGFEIALACDILIASTEARMLLPEVKVGLLATSGGVIRLPRRIPRGVAMEMLYTGRIMEPEEGLRLGLLSRVVSPQALMDTAREVADDIAASAPLSVQAVKAVMNEVAHLSEEEAFKIQNENAAYRRLLASRDFKEGPRAFAEKREPAWEGK